MLSLGGRSEVVLLTQLKGKAVNPSDAVRDPVRPLANHILVSRHKKSKAGSQDKVKGQTRSPSVFYRGGGRVSASVGLPKYSPPSDSRPFVGQNQAERDPEAPRPPRPPRPG